jgi:hypothetical protein
MRGDAPDGGDRGLTAGAPRPPRGCGSGHRVALARDAELVSESRVDLHVRRVARAT